MALIDKKLTELTEILSVPDNAFIHVVDPNDVSQSPQGSSYKAKKSTIGGAVKAQVTVSGTVKTNENNSDPIVYLKSKVDALLSEKQDTLVNGINIASINSQNLLNGGNIEISSSGGVIDSTVIENSTNAVSGGGVFEKLAEKLENSTTLAEPFLTDKLIIKQAPSFTESKEITLADLKTLIGSGGAAKKYAFIQPSLDNGQYSTANLWYGVSKETAGYDSETASNVGLTGTNLYHSRWKGFIPPFVNSKVISGKFVFQFQSSASNSVFEVLLVKADFPNGQSVETPLNYEVVSRTITNQIQQVFLGLFTINLTISAHNVFNTNSFYFWAFKNNSATFYKPLGIAFEFQEQ
jgi:hypothetical protein